jgi:hypothetical protein
MRSALAALIIGLLASVRLPAQGAIVSLLVIDDATDAPLAGVHVSIGGAEFERVTNEQGKLVYAAPSSGKVAFIFRRLGYELGSLMVDVVAGDTARVTFAMTPIAQRLGNVTVVDSVTSASPTLAGFERRALNHAGSASYITRADIVAKRPAQTIDLLRRITSIKIIDSAGVLIPVSRRFDKPVITGPDLDMAPCPLRVVVDGHLREWGFAVNSLTPEEIHGIEVYPGPGTIPAEYASISRDASCGLVAIWTRRDR